MGSVDKFRKQIKERIDKSLGATESLRFYSHETADAILDLELLPGITLKRLVELAKTGKLYQGIDRPDSMLGVVFRPLSSGEKEG